MDKLVGTFEDVQHDLAIINAVAAGWWASQGYTVIQTPDGPAVVGKNAETDEDNTDALTTTWAVPMPVEFTENEETGEITPVEGTLWFIPAPSNDPRFIDWRDYVPEGATLNTVEEIT